MPTTRMKLLQNALAMIFFAASSAAWACPKAGDQYIAWNSNTDGGSLIDTVVMKEAGSPAPGRHERTAAPSRPGIAPFVLDASAGSAAVRLITESAAKAYRPQNDQYSVKVITAFNTTCRALLIQGLEASHTSYIVSFDAAGNITSTQALNLATLGFSLSPYTLAIKDLTSDGRDDIELRESGAVRGVLSAEADGIFKLNTRLSALAVWKSFMDAAKSGHVSVSMAHLSNGGARLLGPSLTELGAKLPKLVQNVVDYDAKVISDELVVITTVVQNTPSTHRAFESFLVKQDGVWRIDAF